MKSSGLPFKDHCKKLMQLHALTINSILSSSSSNSDESTHSHSSMLNRFFLNTHLIEPPIDPHLIPLDFIDSISNLYRRITHSSSESKSCRLCLEQCTLFSAVGDLKLLRRSLQSARKCVVDIHSKVVFSAWLRYERREESSSAFPPWIVSVNLRYERREDELVGVSAMDCISKVLDCPKSTLIDNVCYPSHSIFDRCQYVFENDSGNANVTDSHSSFNNEFLVHDNDDEIVWFCIGNEAQTTCALVKDADIGFHRNCVTSREKVDRMNVTDLTPTMHYNGEVGI
ncbi:hypothetical protein L1887_12389 [Cichorium endivia]|nr:hypothetical protein L1887_12389 [Cichorium endivia]